jgi:hypothetical protein
MSLGVHSTQEATPCYPQRASATFCYGFCTSEMYIPAMQNFEFLSDYFIVVGKYTQSNIIKCSWKSKTSIA